MESISKQSGKRIRKKRNQDRTLSNTSKTENVFDVVSEKVTIEDPQINTKKAEDFEELMPSIEIGKLKSCNFKDNSLDDESASMNFE